MEFGGTWTLQKLEALEKYLPAYTTILTKSAGGRFFKTVYVDAFAGSGKMTVEEKDPLFSTEELQYLKGSASRALATEPPFDRYIFIDADSSNTKNLELLRAEYPEKEIGSRFTMRTPMTFSYTGVSKLTGRKIGR